jgi:D-glycero-D-manno-heptose 1,7-bisphosphate phosphatase
VGLRDGIDGLAVANAEAHTWAGALEQACRELRAGSTWGAAARADALERAAPDDAALEVACAVLAGQLARNGFAAHRAALFLDRDGTLIRNVRYNRDPLAVELEPRVAPALRHLGNAGFVPVVVSNQSGIARGLCAPEEVEAVNGRLRALLQAAGADVSAVYICPHHPDRTGPCECRKPAPGMLLQAQRELGLDLGRSVLVGDSPHDLEAAARAGVRAYGYRNPAAPAGGGTELMNPAGNWLELAWRILQDAANAAP